MAIGFTDLSGTQRVPDKGMTFNNTPTIHVARFGNGYEQRVETGINNLVQDINVNFSDREKAEVDAISTFFESKGSLDFFLFTIPFAGDGTASTEVITEKTIKVVCSNWSTSYSYDNFYTVSATFRRVYE